MRHAKLIWLAMRQLSHYGQHYAGAEMFGGAERRARSDAYRHLSNMTGMAIRGEVRESFKRLSASAQAPGQL